MFDPAALK